MKFSYLVIVVQNGATQETFLNAQGKLYVSKIFKKKGT